MYNMQGTSALLHADKWNNVRFVKVAKMEIQNLFFFILHAPSQQLNSEKKIKNVGFRLDVIFLRFWQV